MDQNMIIVSSITMAMKGRDILFNQGIRAYVERTPQQYNGGRGCSYSIYVPNRSDEAAMIINDNGIKVFGRYEKDNVL